MDESAAPDDGLDHNADKNCESNSLHHLPNVEVIRTNEGAACAPHKPCLRRVSDATIG
jgi:hypothetical protein